MTITIATQPATDRLADTASMPEPVELAAGLFFQPSRVMEEARRLAADGVDVVVTMSLAVLDQAPVTGTSRSLLEASVENRLRSALYAAGFTSVRRRWDVAGSIVLNASS